MAIGAEFALNVMMSPFIVGNILYIMLIQDIWIRHLVKDAEINTFLKS